MNHYGPWSWRSSKQGKPVRTHEEQAYAERVTRNKQNASRDAARKRRQGEAARIRKRNAAPIF